VIRVAGKLRIHYKDFIRVFYSPKSLYREISKGRKCSSWFCVLGYCLIYMMGSLWLYFRGFIPFVKPWIKLPEDVYYLVQAFYLLPLVFLMWILGTGVLHILCKQFGGNGRFEVLLIMTGYSLWAPLVSTNSRRLYSFDSGMAL